MNRNQPDTFICHASEDKEAIARPIHEALTEVGIYAWLDESEIRLGQSIRQKIDEGLADCRSATIILSRSFFAKKWTRYELDGIVGRQMQGEILLFPIQHGITIEEIRDYSPSLAGLSLWNSSDHPPARIASEIASQLRICNTNSVPTPSGSNNPPRRVRGNKRRPRIWHVLHSPHGYRGAPAECGTRNRYIACVFEPNRPHRMDSRVGKQRGTRICHRGRDPTSLVELGEQLGRWGIPSSQSAFRRGTLRSDHTTSQRTTDLPSHRDQQVPGELPHRTEQQVRLDDVSDPVVQDYESNLPIHVP